MEVVKARNVLIQCPSKPDQEQLLRGKLSVFAVTRMRSVFATTEAEASYRWLAPEIARGEPLSERAVIYSFGALLYELDSHQVPFYDTLNPDGSQMSSFKVMLLVSRNELQLELTTECPESIATLASECLSPNPETSGPRPPASRIDSARSSRMSCDTIYVAHGHRMCKWVEQTDLFLGRT